MKTIDKTALIGEYCVIGENVFIGENVVIGHHVVIHDDTIIGDNVKIDDFACIGKKPTKAKNSAVTKECELPPCEIAEGSAIGTSAIIYRGSKLSKGCFIADMAVIRENVTIGKKTIIGKSATIENECSIGNLVKIQTNAYITAYSTVGDNVFVAPCVVTSNDNFAGRSKERFSKFKGVTVKKGGRIGAGAVILPGKTIEEDSFVAAGSVLTRDTTAKKIFLGSPARDIGEVNADQLLENQ